MGMPSLSLPQNVGFPMGETFGGATFYRLEIHYDNQALHQGVIDNSGLRIYYSNELREIEGGILETGLEVNLMHMIPRHQRN